MKTGKTIEEALELKARIEAAMEPGHEDREDQFGPIARARGTPAAMEPGHEDREDYDIPARTIRQWAAAMEPGHEDREDGTKAL